MPDVLAHPVDEKLAKLFGPYLGRPDALRLNLHAETGRPVSGFVNVGQSEGDGIDLAFDLEAPGKFEHQAEAFLHNSGCLPFSNESVDVVLAVRVLERVVFLLPLLKEVARILKLGGHLLIVAPYAGSDNAWENPTNVRAFTELTWAHLTRLGVPLLPAKIKLVPFPDITAPTDGMGVALVGQQGEFEFRKRFMRNVVSEMHVVLEKVEA